MNLTELRDTSYEIAQSKGWHDPDFDRATFADRMALVISELAEALEEYRKGKPARNIEYVKDGVVTCTYAPTGATSLGDIRTGLSLAESGYKPEGIIIELADAAIRIGDAAGKHGLALSEAERPSRASELVSETLSHAQGSFGGWFCAVSHWLCQAAMDEEREREVHLWHALSNLGAMVAWLGISGVEFEHAIEIKHAYNRTRPHRHGGKIL